MSLERKLKRRQMLERRKIVRKWVKQKRAAAVRDAKPVLTPAIKQEPVSEIAVDSTVLEKLNAVLYEQAA